MAAELLDPGLIALVATWQLNLPALVVIVVSLVQFGQGDRPAGCCALEHLRDLHLHRNLPVILLNA
jgi:hypothetical protein